MVKDKSPKMAERYSYLENTSSTARAKAADEETLLIWDMSE